MLRKSQKFTNHLLPSDYRFHSTCVSKTNLRGRVMATLCGGLLQPHASLPRAAVISMRVDVGLKSPWRRWCCHRISCSLGNFDAKTVSSQHSQQLGGVASASNPENQKFNFEVRSPSIPASIIPISRLSLADRAFLLLAFTGCTICVAFTSFVVAAVPTLFAMRRAAISLAKLADTAHHELPSTMAAIRLSGMEISDLTLELSDLSHEIADGVNKSAQAVQAAEAGVRQIGSLAQQQTMSMIQERASLPIISLQPVVAGAAKKTTRAVGRATRTFLNIISRGEHNTVDEDGTSTDEELS